MTTGDQRDAVELERVGSSSARDTGPSIRSSYEREAIERWLSTSNNSPLTGLRLPHKNLTPNHALRALAQGVGA